MSSKLLSHIQNYSLWFLLVLLPSNLGYHFYSDESYVLGLRVDYLIPTLYLTDLLLALFLISFFIQVSQDSVLRKKIKEIIQRPTFLLIVVFLLLVVPNLYIGKPMAAWYKWFSLVKVLLLSVTLGAYYSTKKVPFIISGVRAGILLQAGIVFFQIIKQSSLFGYLFLGESVYDAMTIGVAKTSLYGQLYVRPYGVTPHPNVLGGFLVVYLLLLIGAVYTSQYRSQRFLDIFTVAVGTLVLFSTLSRTASLGGFVGLTVLYFISRYRKRSQVAKSLRYVFGIILLLFGSFLGFLFQSRGLLEAEAITQRIELNSIALKMFNESLFFGVGLNQFTAVMEKFGSVTSVYRFLQPVHNIFLLMAAEGGIFGVVSYLSVWVVALKKAWTKNVFTFPALVTVLILGLGDHYVVSMQQGLLLWGLVVGLSFAESA